MIQENETITADWIRSKCIGLTLDRDYEGKQVHISMPNYLEKALKRFGHDVPNRHQYQPHIHTLPKYGAMMQYTTAPNEFPLLNKASKKFIQGVNGKFLYLGLDQVIN